MEEDMEVMNKDFACLSKENRQKVLDVTKYLVLTQNTFVPAILQNKQSERRELRNEKPL